jgi:hypothetical protein
MNDQIIINEDNDLFFVKIVTKQKNFKKTD